MGNYRIIYFVEEEIKVVKVTKLAIEKTSTNNLSLYRCSARSQGSRSAIR